MATDFLALEEASAGADTAVMGTVSLGAAGVTAIEGAEITTSSAGAGVAVETAGADRGSVEALGSTEGATGSTEISEGRVESISTKGVSGTSRQGGDGFGAGGEAARAGLGILVSSTGGGDGCRIGRLVMLGPPGLTESRALRK